MNLLSGRRRARGRGGRLVFFLVLSSILEMLARALRESTQKLLYVFLRGYDVSKMAGASTLPSFFGSHIFSHLHHTIPSITSIKLHPQNQSSHLNTFDLLWLSESRKKMVVHTVLPSSLF